MEDNNKYYTPSIDEFYQGFEFEFNTGNEGWIKQVSDPRPPYSFYTEKYRDLARVKYLDQEDIESLGWKPGMIKIGNNTIDVYGLGEYVITETKYKLDISLVTYIVKSKLNRIFRGTIKNKSELKKLMKQLGINE